MSLTVTKQNKKDLNIGSLLSKIKNNLIRLDIEVQRGLVWDSKRKSRLIRSILCEKSINPFYFNVVKEEVNGKSVEIWKCIDGKQRISAINDFIAKDIKLYAKTESVLSETGEEIQIAKKSYSNLPDELQKKLMGYGTLTYTYENLPLEEEIELFVDINSGKPVTPADLIRTKVKSRKEFIELSNHPVLTVLLAEKRTNKLEDEDIVEDAWMMGYVDNPSLARNYKSPLLTDEITEEEKNEMFESLNYVQELVKKVSKEKKLLRKIKMRSHLPMIIYAGVIAIQKNRNAEFFIEKIQGFYTTEGNKGTNSKEYNDANQQGVGKPEQVKARMDAIDELFV